MQEGQYNFLKNRLKNPFETEEVSADELKQLAEKYPASNFIHALLARKAMNNGDSKEHLGRAAIYSSHREALYFLLYDPARFLEIDEKPDSREDGETGSLAGGVVEEVEEVGSVGVREEVASHEAPAEEENRVVKEAASESRDDGETGSSAGAVVEKVGSVDAEDKIYDEIASHGVPAEEEKVLVKEAESGSRNDAETGSREEGVLESQVIDDEVYNEIAWHDASAQNAENLPVNEAQEESGQLENPEVHEGIAEHTPVFTPQKEHQPAAEIDDEVFEEISEAPLAGRKTEDGFSVQPETANKKDFHVETIVPESDEQPVAVKGQIDVVQADFTDENSQPAYFHIETIVPESDEPPVEVRGTTDQQRASFTDRNIPVADFNIETVVPDAEKPSAEQQTQPSRYHDEKMPYSFMWWLDKTRKEHAQTYQPYASPDQRPETAVAPAAEKPPLEQQYIEHIFHLQSVEDLDRTTQSRTVPFTVARKEDTIIEKFIKEEPQISTPRPEKLDTENKARKSTEDHLEMVSETLARIYTEQMLYHKAIDTYQKLSLKYPDKSTYFAARITELNEKIR